MNSPNELFAMGNSSGFHWTDLLLAEVELTPQYILEVADGCWECRCGNKSNSDGFETCSEFGVLVPSELGLWDGVLWACIRCWRVINGDTLEVLGFADESAVYTNLEFQWG